MRRSIFARMLFAVAVMVAALLLAPTSSFAHAGHDHGRAGTEVIQPVVSTQSVEDSSPEQTARSAPRAEQMVVTLLPGSTGDATVICRGGCCSAASPSCCAVSLAAILGIPTPTLGKPIFAILHSEGVGITPGTLTKPPKSLV
jgi:hypothetical protein